MLNDNHSVDFQNAYRRLSNANLAFSGGSLSELSRRKISDDGTGYGRLEKDYMSPDGDLLPDDSSDDNGESSSDDDDERGRKAARSFEKGCETAHANTGSQSPQTTRKSLSLLAAAEEERKFHFCQQYCWNSD
jgi:hypothetical protein